jgi:multiple sugar transport system ATP-binding protein
LAALDILGLTRTFPGGVEALRGIDLSLGDGRRLAIVGPSGSGKTTVLRLIAGLDAPSAGSIRIGGEAVEGLSPASRNVALVFQSPALYPHLDVFENLAFGLRARGEPRGEIAARVVETARLLGIEPMLRRRPASLSGGEKQRVALGRAIARRPRLLMLDEPFSGLDAPLRTAIRRELADLQRRLGLTTVLVTHDQAEALAWGDLVAVLDGGRLLQCDEPEAVYRRPAAIGVARFIGNPPMDLLPGRLDREAGEPRLVLAGIERPIPFSSEGLRTRKPGLVKLGVRAEDAREAPAEPDPAALILEGRIRRVEATGNERLWTIACDGDGGELHLRRPVADHRGPGDRVRLSIDLRAASWFDPETGLRIG